ncbi:MAG: isochorismatase family protein [Nitrosarchaeum sp.]|nr:isochorismatase family protein [Nitrosarchaeum sp.]
MISITKEKTASFDVDAQNTFTPQCPGELPIINGDKIVWELNGQAQLARLRIGSKDAHSLSAVWLADDVHRQFEVVNGYKDVDIRWNAHAIVGTHGFKLISGLPEVTEYDFFVWKGVESNLHPYGACYHDLNNKLSTGVKEFLNCFIKPIIDTVIIGGLATDYCVKMTALQLADDFHVIVNLGACRGVAPDTTNKAIDEMTAAGVHFINSYSELISEKE